MIKRKTGIVILALNCLVLIALGYFTYNGYYSRRTISVWLNPSYYSFDIRTEVKLLVGLSVVIPLLLAYIKKQYLWLVQSVIIILLILNFKSDILQKTIFINQPSSLQCTNIEIEKMITENENRLNSIINSIEKKQLSAINQTELNQYSSDSDFIILSVNFKGKEVKTISIIPKKDRKYYHSYQLRYFPDGFNKKDFTTPPSLLGSNLFLLNYANYYYGKKWIIMIDGMASG